MRHGITLIGFGIVTSLAIPSFGQNTDATTASSAAATAPVAYVYVGTSAGVDLYDAASNGKLALVRGSPFPITGRAVGSNGRYFISLGTYLIHSYAVSSSGAIGGQVSTIDTQDYFGGQCDGHDNATSGLAILDHTGHNLYVNFSNDFGLCDASSIQTYDISKAGLLTFDGGILTGGNAGFGLLQAPTISGNDTFAYAASFFGCCAEPPQWSGYMRASNGELENLTFNLSNNTIPFGYVPFYVTADPTNHLAAIVEYNFGPGQYNPAQLASYTIDSKGNLSTTSTAKNMPRPKVTPSVLDMSPSGKLLAVGGSGLQVFHFNGANPITPYSSVLTEAAISEIYWDNNNHLYALSEAQTSSILNWNATDVAQAKITGSDGSSIQIGNCHPTCGGQNTVSLKATTIYTITGTGTNGRKVAASVTVTVNSKAATIKAPPGPSSSSGSSVSLTANPTTITTYSRLFVYTVTPTKITAAPGSPYVISSHGVDALIVVPVP